MTLVIKQRFVVTLLLGVVLAGCNMPALEPLELEEVEHDGQITPLVVQSLPAPQVFTTPGQVTAPPTLELDPITEEIPITEMCVISDIGLRLRSDPHLDENNENVLIAMPRGTDVTWSGNQVEADGHTWYELEMSDQRKGWSAIDPDWIAEGTCAQFQVGGITPLIIDQACISGYVWVNEGDDTHYAVDLWSKTGKSALHAPYSGTVAASDDCPACTADNNKTGKHLGNTTNPDLNYGYGAMIVLEFPYSDISQEELDELIKDDVEIEEGESLYMLIAHLDPTETISASGADLEPGDIVATIGTSGNSTGNHAHVEVAVNESGLRPSSGQIVPSFWGSSIAEKSKDNQQGLRFDPLPLFDMPFNAASCPKSTE